MASLFTLGKPATLECEVSRVRAENQALIEELAQCQTDKDFVWSLWKRLQVTSPDITQVVSMVVQREKEKADIKDKKVLEILQLKDNKIEELHKLTGSHQHEVDNLIAIKLELQNDVKCVQLENQNLNDRCLSFASRTQELEDREQSQTNRHVIRDMDQQILELKQKLSKQTDEITGLLGDHVDLASIKDTHKSRILTLEDDLKTMGMRYDQLASDHTEARSLVRKYEKQLLSLQADLDAKTQDLDSVRCELSTIWSSHSQSTDHATQQAHLIRQLRNLQADTQLMLKNQEEAFGMESQSLQTQLMEQEALIAGYQRQLDELGANPLTITYGHTRQSTGLLESNIEMKQRLQQLQMQLNSLQGELLKPAQYSQTTCDRASSPVRNHSVRGRSLNRKACRAQALQDHKGRSKSEPRTKKPLDGTNKEGDFVLVGKTVEKMEHMLQLKNDELDEMTCAHNRRLERLQSLQSNYRLLKKQLKLAEDELNGPRKKRRRLQRSDVKSLQNEDSDGVWNELAYFKHENRNLLVERTNVVEELDILKVQAAQDKATIYELRSCLDQEREELQFLTEGQTKCPSPTPDLEIELKQSNKQVKIFKNEIKRLHDDNKILQDDKEQRMIERRDLKSQLNLLGRKEADYRIKIADLNKELGRLNRELKRRRKTKAKTTVAKQYQQVLNRSIHQMKEVFNHFDEDGWEEISECEMDKDSCEDLTCTTVTGESLGETIAEQASRTLLSDVTQPEYTSKHSSRRNIDNYRRDGTTDRHERLRQHRRLHSHTVPSGIDHSPVRRDVAVSPIHFLDAKASGSRSHSPPSRVRPVMTSVATSPHKLSGKNFCKTGSNRQVATLKQRVQTLQHQVTLMRTTRDHAMQKNTEQKNQIAQLETDLTLSNQKLQSSRMTVQRLTSDLDRLRDNKQLIEQQLQEHSFETNSTSHSDQEWNLIQSRLKTTTNEISRQLTQIRQLKSENAKLKASIQQSQDRLNHMERDVSQKRTLLEDMRIKLRFAQENAQTDADVMTEVENKLKNLSDSNSRYKTQGDSLKQRLTVVSNEKRESEERVLKVSEEFERKMKQASELQRKNSELQSTVVAIERTAQEQLHVLASQSEIAIDSAQTKLLHANTLIQEHDHFIKVFSHALLNSVQQARSLWQQQKMRKVAPTPPPGDQIDPSMRRAQSLACDILNISQSDLDDIMSGKDTDSLKTQSVAERSEEAKNDRKWSKKLEKTLQKVEFAVPITELFMDKVGERNNLAAKLQMT